MPKAQPPPRAERRQPARKQEGDGFEVTISDVQLSVGGDATATIEIAALGDWKFNGEFPVRAVLSGLKVAASPEHLLRSTSPQPNGFRVTSGGVRLDIPLTGIAAGTDEVTATVRFGICSATTCEFREHQVAWKIAVAE